MASRSRRHWLVASALAAFGLVAGALPSLAGTLSTASPAQTVSNVTTSVPDNEFSDEVTNPLSMPNPAGAAAGSAGTKGGTGGSLGGWRRTATTNDPEEPTDPDDPPPVTGGCNSTMAWRTLLTHHEDYGAESRTGINAQVACYGVALPRVWHRLSAVDRTPQYNGFPITETDDPFVPVFECRNCFGGSMGAVLRLYGDAFDNARQFEIVHEIELELPGFLAWESCSPPPGFRFLETCVGLGTPFLRVVVGSGAQTSLLAPPVIKYVALGDSYASGSGTGLYKNDGTDCQRSLASYPEQLSARGLTISGFRLRPPNLQACHGAQIIDFYSAQAGSGVMFPQLDWLNVHQTRLVTLSIGINDLGLPDRAMRCALVEEDCSLGGPLISSAAYDAFSTNLDILISAIKPRMRPDGYLVVLLYPFIAPLANNPEDVNPNFCPFGLLDQEVDALNDATAELNSAIISVAAMDADPRVRLAFTSAVLSGHRLCATDEWVNGFDIPFPSDEAYHPNARGYEEVTTELLSTVAGLHFQPRIS
jgi:hypothetical protein